MNEIADKLITDYFEKLLCKLSAEEIKEKINTYKKKEDTGF